MKFLASLLIVTLALLHVASARLSFAHRSPPHPDCKEHVRYITQEQVAQLNKGGYPDSQVIRAHLLCIWKEKGAMDERGNLQPHVIKTKIVGEISGSPEVRKGVERCIIQKPDPAATAYAFYSCISPFLAKYN